MVLCMNPVVYKMPVFNFVTSFAQRRNLSRPRFDVKFYRIFSILEEMEGLLPSGQAGVLSPTLEAF